MGVDRRAALRAWSSFRGSGPTTLGFLAARLAIVPLGALDGELRDLSGRVLSLGCGHGVAERYLAEVNPDVHIDGFELDDKRVVAAGRSQHRAPRVTIHCADVTRLEEQGGYDGALAIDVMHHIEPTAHAGVATALARSLRPGGVALVKDMALTPRWKYRWNRFHDRVVAGERVHCLEPDDMAALFESAGLQTSRVERVDRAGSPYPQYLVRLVKP